MSNKDIEEDIEICKEIIRTNMFNRHTDAQAIENILADRKRLIIENEIQEENYENLSADVSCIGKELDLEEDATIDEIYIAIRILKSKRTDMFKYIDKANKYDRLVEKIKKDIEEYPEATYTKYYLLDCIELLKGE